MWKGRLRLGRVHKLLGLIVGLQFLFWTVSGLFFTLFPIEVIHGDKWRPAPVHGNVAEMVVVIDAKAASAKVDGKLARAELRAFLDNPVWIVETDTSRAMVDAVSGIVRSPLSAEDFAALRTRFWTDNSTTSAPGTWSRDFLLLADPPREYGGPLPTWVSEYAPGAQRIYVDAVTGDIQSVRTTRWRIFDVLWRFHILDLTGKDEFDTWWMKLVAFLGLTTVLFGIALLIDRARRGALLR